MFYSMVVFIVICRKVYFKECIDWKSIGFYNGVIYGDVDNEKDCVKSLYCDKDE